MTYDEWVEIYRPIKNPFNDSRGFDGIMFETFGEELDMVRATPDPRCIWTFICGEADTISSGWHLVNRMGYFITEVPFDGDFLEIDLDDDDDLDDEDRCRTEGCDEDPNDGEGFDGYCGNCADRLDQEGAFD